MSSIILIIEFSGVFISWDVDAIIRSVIYSLALSYSAFITSVISEIVVKVQFFP